MRWLVMGAGATGGYFGGMLARAGAGVTFIARGPHRDAIRRHGLTVGSPEGDFTVDAAVTDDPAQAPTPDVVLFAVKGFDTEQAAAALTPAVGPGTAILCIQNGVENEDHLAARFGAERVLGGATRIEATITEPGAVRRLSPFAHLAFGSWAGPAGGRERAVLDELIAAGIDAALADDARRVVWEKFFMLCPLASITSIARAPIGEIASVPESRELLRRAVAEVEAVARAGGIDLGGSAGVEAMLGTITSLPPAMRSSMERDISAGRRVELDALTGAVVRLGRQAGVPVPVHEVVYAALKPAALAAERAHAP